MLPRTDEKYSMRQQQFEESFAKTFVYYMIYVKGTTQITSNINPGTLSFTVANPAGAVVGEAVHLTGGDLVSQSIISNIAGNLITVSSPVDNVFPANAGACRFGAWNLALNGSVTPIISELIPCGRAKWEVHEIRISILAATAMTDDKFGGITALTKPVVLRQKDGTVCNIFQVVNNIGFVEHGFNSDYRDRIGATNYGVNFVKNMKQTCGAVFYIDGATADEFEFYNNSNLTGNAMLTITFHGKNRWQA